MMHSQLGLFALLASLVKSSRGQDVGVPPTTCDPTRSECPPVAAIGRQVECDFSNGACKSARTLGRISYDDVNGIELMADGMESLFDLQSILTPRYLFFGKIEVELQGAPGPSLSTDISLSSRSSESINWTLYGDRNDTAKSNYFTKTMRPSTDTLHNVSDATGAFHNYTIEWTSSRISWSIDGEEVRWIEPHVSDSGDTYPQTPMQLNIGVHVTGTFSPNNTDVNVDWETGSVVVNPGPWSGWVKRFTITDYAGGFEPTKKNVEAYAYTDQSGTWESIRVVEKGEVLDDVNAPGETETETAIADDIEPPRETTTLTPGAIAGITVGAIAGVLISAAIGFFIYRRKRQPAAAAEKGDDVSTNTVDGVSPMSSPPAYPSEVDGNALATELDAKDKPVELPAKHELGTQQEPAELESPSSRRFSFDKTPRAAYSVVDR